MRDNAHTQKVFIVTDRETRRRRLTHRIGDLPDCMLAGEAYSCQEASAVIPSERSDIDVILLDLSIENFRGCRLIRQLSSKASTPPILAIASLNVGDPAEEARCALIAGALGYLTGDEIDKLLGTAIRQIRAGTIFLSDQMKEALRKLDGAPV